MPLFPRRTSWWTRCPDRRRGVIVAAGALLLAGAAGGAAWACGPWYPDRLLGQGARRLLDPPVSSFARELEGMRSGLDRAALPRAKPPAAPGDYRRQTAEADVADLRFALDNHDGPGLPAGARQRLLADYAAWRKLLREMAEQTGEPAPGASPDAGMADRLRGAVLPEGLPGEFADYAHGARAFLLGDLDEARGHWEGLLTRPEAERRFRSTWAAYMLGQLARRRSDAPATARWFGEARTLAARGFVDSLGLAAASVGWLARAELDAGRPAGAARLYLDQLAGGDEGAVDSLQVTAQRALRDPASPSLAGLAADADLRRVVTAYVIARYPTSEAEPGAGNGDAARWQEAVEAAGVATVEEADHLAWAAYQHGAFDLAARWLERAPAGTVLARWLRAKLELRAGHLEAAAELMAAVVRALPDDAAEDDRDDWVHYPPAPYTMFSLRSQRRQATAELGALRLGVEDFVGALDGLLRARFWRDAAYVAERLLTADELRAYVDARWPERAGDLPDVPVGSFYFFDAPDNPGYPYRLGLLRPGEEGVSIRYLLARRLARLQRWEQAGPYYPAALEPRFKALRQAWADGHDLSLPPTRRAWALWAAAKRTRHDGLELLGTEGEPDWRTFGGDYTEPWLSVARGATPGVPPAPRFPAEYEGDWSDEDNRLTELSNTSDRPREVLPASAQEQRRLAAQPVVPENRWHYRYVAADLAWEAARILPDDQEETARVLCAAGGWLKRRDPLSADRFYQALEKRCPHTALGQEAVRRRWFPPGLAEP